MNVSQLDIFFFEFFLRNFSLNTWPGTLISTVILQFSCLFEMSMLRCWRMFEFLSHVCLVFLHLLLYSNSWNVITVNFRESIIEVLHNISDEEWAYLCCSFCLSISSWKPIFLISSTGVVEKIVVPFAMCHWFGRHFWC